MQGELKQIKWRQNSDGVGCMALGFYIKALGLDLGLDS